MRLRRTDPLVLAFDTAGAACSVAVAAGDAVLAAQHLPMLHGQAEALLPMVDSMMGAAGVPAAALDLIAVTVGPGSFTGIRVGLAAARGIALAAGVPLFGATGFAAIAAGLDHDCNGRFLLAAIDSRRADLYIQLFDPARRPLGEPAAVLPEALAAAVAAVAGAAPLVIAGDAAERAAGALARRPRTIVAANLPGNSPAAALGVVQAALARWRAGDQPGDARPLYLRPPDATFAGGGRAPGRS